MSYDMPCPFTCTHCGIICICGRPPLQSSPFNAWHVQFIYIAASLALSPVSDNLIWCHSILYASL